MEKSIKHAFSANCRVKRVLASSMHTQAVSTNKHPTRQVVTVLLALVVAVLLVQASVKSSVVTVLQESKARI